MRHCRAIAWLVIGTVVVCPFPCLAEAVGALDGDATVSRDLCPCCGPVQNTKPAPRQSSNGGTCLCHGAVLENVAHLPALDFRLMSYFVGDSDLLSDTTSVRCTRTEQPSACDFAVADSGRTIRALIESLLI